MKALGLLLLAAAVAVNAHQGFGHGDGRPKPFFPGMGRGFPGMGYGGGDVRSGGRGQHHKFFPPHFFKYFFENKEEAKEFFKAAHKDLFPAFQEEQVNCTLVDKFFEDLPKEKDPVKEKRMEKLANLMVVKKCMFRDMVTCSKWSAYTPCTEKTDGVQVKSRTCSCDVCGQTYEVPKVLPHGGVCFDKEETNMFDEESDNVISEEVEDDEDVDVDESNEPDSVFERKHRMKQKTCGITVKKCEADY